MRGGGAPRVGWQTVETERAGKKDFSTRDCARAADGEGSEDVRSVLAGKTTKVHFLSQPLRVLEFESFDMLVRIRVNLMDHDRHVTIFEEQ